MSPQLVLVDDTNTNIRYSGPWFTAQNTQSTTGNFGPPFQDTLHGVNVNASLSFSFSGSSVTVLGTSVTTNSSGTQNPTWECFVDNSSIGWRTVLQFAENNWIFCENDQLPDGPHVLSVNATVSSQQTFWFDQIQYLPSSNVVLDQQTLRIESNDSALQYSSAWQVLDGIVNLTQTAGSTLTYEFSGVSIAWFGFIPGHFPFNTSSATYSIDGQIPTNFLVPALSDDGAMELYNQVLFQTGHLSAGQHTLVVTHQGNTGAAPLALDYFVVQREFSSNGTSSSSSSANSAINTATVTPVSSGTSTKTPLGAIIGGVLGGLVLLLLLVFLSLFMRRRNRRAQKLSEKLEFDPPYHVVDPFITPPSHSSPTLQSQHHTSESLSPTPHLTPNKRRLPADISGSGLGVDLTPSRNHAPNDSLQSIASAQAIATSSSSSAPSPALPQSIGTTGKARAAETAQPAQGLASPQSSDTRILRHQDSGIRIPPVEENIVELPPLYTPG